VDQRAERMAAERRLMQCTASEAKKQAAEAKRQAGAKAAQKTELPAELERDLERMRANQPATLSRKFQAACGADFDLSTVLRDCFIECICHAQAQVSPKSGPTRPDEAAFISPRTMRGSPRSQSASDSTRRKVIVKEDQSCAFNTAEDFEEHLAVQDPTEGYYQDPTEGYSLVFTEHFSQGQAWFRHVAKIDEGQVLADLSSNMVEKPSHGKSGDSFFSARILGHMGPRA